MTPEQKIANVEAQVLALRRMHEADRSALGTLICPYCGGENLEKYGICCDLLRKAMAAVVIKLKDAEDVEFFQRIQEGIVNQAKHARN